jgi:hypothetical protein
VKSSVFGQSGRLAEFRQSTDLKAATEDSEARLRLSALEKRLLQCDGDFAALRQIQESTTAPLTDSIFRPSRIEATFAYATLVPISPRNAMATPPAPLLITLLSTRWYLLFDLFMFETVDFEA